MSNYWEDKKVVVTGGAALIGSHLVEYLISQNVKDIWVVDNLSSGKKENLPKGFNIIEGDCRDSFTAEHNFMNADIVFHLACQHGGRGYVDTHPVACADNLSLDATVFRAARMAGVQKVIFASSACVYPLWLQNDIRKEVRLSEEMCHWDNPSQADGQYGWAKLMGEMTLDAYVAEGYFHGVSTRFFTVYGPRMKQNHAIAAMIAKTFIKQRPFEIWGNGNQFRNWTYVKDTVRGMALAAVYMNRGAVNIGIEDKITVNQAVAQVMELMGYDPYKDSHPLSAVVWTPDKPTGPVNRIADARKAHYSLDWWPAYSFKEGLQETIEWYLATHNEDEVRAGLEESLTAV